MAEQEPKIPEEDIIKLKRANLDNSQIGSLITFRRRHRNTIPPEKLEFLKYLYQKGKA